MRRKGRSVLRQNQPSGLPASWAAAGAGGAAGAGLLTTAPFRRPQARGEVLLLTPAEERAVGGSPLMTIRSAGGELARKSRRHGPSRGAGEAQRSSDSEVDTAGARGGGAVSRGRSVFDRAPG